ncbi:MAG TPA: HEPN domain-containing protein [Candidatus Angelobacter sp.]|nr:HEPN domain-containing protein [Candidatus Angelobacter sp.]
MSDPMELFVENTKEVTGLMEIHEQQTGTSPGRRAQNVEILNKSAIVLLTACWEAFIEDAASTGFEFILTESTDISKLPKEILKRVAKLIKEDKNDIKMWDLALSGWKQVLRSYKQQMLHSHISFFHTPKAGNVDGLFQALLDLPDLSSNWAWQKMTSDGAKKRLEEYIQLRGSIAHRVKTSNRVYKQGVSEYAEFINRLACRTANVVRIHVHSLVNKYPWEKYTYGKFS